MRFATESMDTDQSANGPRMRVIGAGLSRCATSSLQAAFEMPALGYFPCMHMAHVAPNATRLQIVIDAMQESDTQKRRKLLHKIFDGYQATTDFPGLWFMDDLMDMYPDAAIVLNQRRGGGVSWYKSMDDNLMFFGSWAYYLLCFPMKTDRLHWNVHRVANRDWVKKWGVGPSAEFYDVYQSFILSEAKKRGREVLIWKAEDGWAPLCKFLGKEVPKDEPFPWVNDAATIQFLKRILIARGVLSWMTLLGGAYATWNYWPAMLCQGAKALDALKSGISLT